MTIQGAQAFDIPAKEQKSISKLVIRVQYGILILSLQSTL
jgi:hypothetical protein